MITGLHNETQPVLKEKYVALFEQLFNGQVLFQSSEEEVFWDELFLLKINSKYLENCVAMSSEDELLGLSKTILNPLFAACLTYTQNVSFIRRANALQTMCILLKGLFKKKWNNFSVNVLTVVSGFQSADEYFKKLLQSCVEAAMQEKNAKVKQLALALFVIILTGHENINQNALIDYFTLVDVFDSLIHVIEWKPSTMKMKKNAMVCLAILVNYRKYESMKQNIYSQHLKELQSPSAILAISDVITKYLYIFSAAFEKTIAENTSILSYVYSFFSSAPAQTSNKANQTATTAMDVKSVSSMLLIFYELVHLNEDFVGSLTRSQASIAANEDNQRRLEKETSSDIKDRLHERDRRELVKACPLLMQEFMKFCSILFQEPHYTNNYVLSTQTASLGVDISTQYYAQFCLLIILCLADKRVFRNFIFDINLKLDFSIFVRERGKFSLKEYSGSGALAKVILEILVSFLNCYSMKQHLPMELFSKALSATHALIVNAKKFRVRFSIEWKFLWSALIRICDIVAEGNCNRDKAKACQILGQVLTIFNFGILKGDMFFPTRKDQEEMIYQFIYQRPVFDKLNDWMQRNLKKKNPAMKLAQNVEIIITDVVMNLDNKYGDAYPSEVEVLGIIKKVMPDIKIVKIEGLEQREEYLENPNEVTFFNRIVRLFVHEIRTGMVEASFQQQMAFE